MPNVTDIGLAEYLDLFHRDYTGTVERLIPSDLRSNLLRYSIMETSGIAGYVSTQYGPGFEYVPDQQGIQIQRSSRPVEDIFLNAPAYVRKLRNEGPRGIRIENSGVLLSNVSFKNLYPFELIGPEASVRMHECQFQVGLWRRNVLAAELYGNRTEEFWSEARAIANAKDEIIVALVDIEGSKRHHQSLSDYLQSAKQRQVLVLGDFSPDGRSRLIRIEDELRGLGYEPIRLDQIPDEPTHDLRQKFLVMALVCRFCVFDDSSRGGHIAELENARIANVPMIVLHQAGTERTYMTRAMALDSRMVREDEYTVESISAVLTEGTTWVEALLQERAEELEKLYPWRAA